MPPPDSPKEAGDDPNRGRQSTSNVSRGLKEPEDSRKFRLPIAKESARRQGHVGLDVEQGKHVLRIDSRNHSLGGVQIEPEKWEKRCSSTLLPVTMAMVLDAFVGRCIETLAASIGNKLAVVIEVKDELENLRRRLERISYVLKDAERRRIQDSAISNWLNELKDVMYDADDIIDLCRAEGGTLLDDQPPAPQTPPPVCCRFPLVSCFAGVKLRHEIGNRIRSLNKRLDAISRDELMQKLEQSSPDVVLNRGVNLRQTDPLLEQDIVGNEINDATEDLVDFLTRRNDINCCLCAITGMGGIGKTTLAQKIFNDPKTQDIFQVRAWVCVTQKFSEIELLKQIIRETRVNYREDMTKAELQPMLRDAVRGQSLFLVLDDVWQADVWVDLLRNPILQSGVANGRILVTTRDENIAHQMGSARIHRVKLLPDDSGWELLCKKAFVSGGEEDMENLKDVGFDIVSRCKGLPLAIKTVGSLLATKQRAMEDVAEEYWKELQRRSLLQPLPNSLVESPCVMHDLLRSLAQFLSRDECFYGDADAIKSTPTSKLRRLSVREEGERVAIPESVIQKKCLRTLMVLKTPPVVEDKLLARLPRLRVLLLNGRGIQSIPDSIGNLTHLRYLDLRETDVSSLPESIERLRNLLTLNVMDCRYLRSLPRGVTRLLNLRRLGLFNSAVCNVPKGIGRLQHLNDISGFIVGGEEDDRGGGCDLEELNSLHELRKLRIFNLERVSNGASVLFHKNHLTRLALLCTPYSCRLGGTLYTEEEITRIGRVFDKLRPPPCLEEELWIDGFFGRSFPSWMMSSLGTSFPRLTRLFLLRCELCQKLPPLGRLPELKYLHIGAASALVRIGHEFLGDETSKAASTVVFPKLKIFRIEDMPNWETWNLGGSGGQEHYGEPQTLLRLPRLEDLVVRNCPKLSALPIGTNGVHKVRTFPALSRLTIHDCSALEYMENLDALEYLKLVDESMEHLPPWLPGLIQGRRSRFKMDVFCNLRLLKRCLDDGPDWPIVREIPIANIYSDTVNGRASLHHVKETSYYRTTNI
ncbi:unnamed protein product [Musa acuminata subsp. burmannicoides]